MLYDLYFDPDQLHNLIDMPSMETVLRELRESLVQRMKETADPLCDATVPQVKGIKVTDPDAFLADKQQALIGK